MSYACFSPLLGPPPGVETCRAHPRPAARVLVIEDDPLTRRAVADLLALEGCAVLEAATGEQGLARVRSDAPDVVLLDLGLPRLSGLEVLRILKGAAATRSVPVVVMSAYAGLLAPGDARLADGLLEKPFCADALLDRVARALPTEAGLAGDTRG